MSHPVAALNQVAGSLKWLGVAGVLFLAHSASAGGETRELAQKLHQRLVGAPANAWTLDAMEPLVAQGDMRGAALEAMSLS